MSIIKKIKSYNKNTQNILFTTPSHAQGAFIPNEAKEILGKQFFRADFSEIEGFDNLRNPKGIIKDLQKNISNIYNSKDSFILTNGATSGVIAAMLSVLTPFDKVLIARNCHLSVYNALVLIGAYPVWIMPDIDSEWGIFKAISPEQIDKNLTADKHIRAVILTNPTYEGIFSDIAAISKICKKHNTTLIVDEAHGALLNFGEFKTKASILSGADISIQSLHKTAGAPNPCALLHISKSSGIDSAKIQSSLNIINTTSPSYPLMCAIEACVNFLNSSEGYKKVSDLLTAIIKFKSKLNSKIICYDGNNDPTKLLVKIQGTNSLLISEILNNEYKIEEEYSTERAMLFITGIGTSSSKLKRLASALNDIQKQYKYEDIILSDFNDSPQLPAIQYTPREAFFKQNKKISLKNAINKISAECIMKYPPGVPILFAGEIINEQTIQMCQQKEIRVCVD